MKASIEEVNTVQRRIKIELSEADVNTAFDTVYRNLKRKAHIRGFRPGKAPLPVLKKFYGNSVAVDVADRLVRDHLFSAIQNESINPIAAPVLETAELPQENTSYSFSALIDILPQVKVEGYKGLTLKVQVFNADESALERELEILQRRHGKTKELESNVEASSGHIATITQKASLNGEEFPPFNFEKIPVELGKKFLLEEMEQGLMGMKVGEEKALKVKVPEHFNDKDLVGQEIDCVLTLEGLQEMVLPEVNDEFAKDLGYENLESLRSNIRSGLEKHAEQSKRNQLESEILEQLSEKNQFDVPPSMVDQVIDSMFQEMQFKSDQEREAARKDQTRRNQLLESAKQRVKNTIILSEVIKSEKIDVSDADLDQFVRDMIQDSGSKAGEEIDAELVENIKSSMGNQAKESLLFRKAIDFIIDSSELQEEKAAP